ncbi:MAG: ATP-binding protein [Clostridia bacterium]|nr:ATP-binding protein [Clostridia bacterium]
MTKSESIRRAKEVIASRRAESIAAYERRTAEVAAAVPEFAEIDRELQKTGPRIAAASFGGGDAKAEIEAIRREYEAVAARRRALLEEHGYPPDYCTIRYSCEKCSDTGYVGIDICDCLKREIVENFLESSGLYSLTKNQTFDTFCLDYYEKDDRIGMEKNVSYLRDYAEAFDPASSPNLIFIGATGLGKTHLSSAVARRVIERGFFVVYECAQGLFSEFEARRFRTNSYTDADGSDVDRFSDCDLLIIDDLGTEITNKFSISCLYFLLNQRLIRHLPTIISTNLRGAELRSRYEDRIMSRIFGEFQPLSFSGSDVRMQKIKKTTEI